MATLLSDNFNRANSTSVVGAPQIGPTPTVLSGAAGIFTNQFYVVSTPGNVSWALGTPDVEITATNMNTLSTTGMSVLLGIIDNLNYWQIQFQTNSVTLFQLVAGNALTAYISMVRNPAATGSVCKVHYRDGIIRVYVDGTLVIRHAVAVPITAGSHGMRSTTPTRYLDTLLVEDAPVIDEPTKTGDIAAGLDLAGDELYADPGFAYLGRDLKTQDAAAGA